MSKARVFASIVAAAVGAAAFSGPAAAQDIRRGPAGWEAHFGGGCIVYYNWQGVRMGDTPPCGSVQRRIADGWMRAHLATTGGSGIVRPPLGTIEPIVRVFRDGSGYVDLRNGCVMRYNRLGYRYSDTRPCDRDMRRHADRLFIERAYGGGYGGYPSGGYGAPRTYWWGAFVRVDFPGTDCSYVYSRDGRHQQTIGSSCTSRLRDIANDAQQAFLRMR
jgi:hypothetical protein